METHRKKELTLLEHIERIVELSEKSKLNGKFYEKAGKDIETVCRILNLNSIQAILFSHLVNCSNNSSILISEITEKLGIKIIRLIQYQDDIDDLEKRRLVRCYRSDNSRSYRMPLEVLDALRKGENVKPPADRKNLSVELFFDTLNQLFEQFCNKEMSHISETKSAWFGESEKKIKAVFEKYKSLVKTEKVTPILLFNEADAVIGKRKDGSSSAVVQTENAIQNIILQEMENLEGIMIVTTNLTQNLDRAFERRFLYKIEFEKPCAEAKLNIWQSIISELNDDEAAELSRRFDFSGGHIENVARKCTVDSIISGKDADFDTLLFHCTNELLAGSRKPAGFILNQKSTC
ncbi:MAG: ATP-binding protein [Tannerella sp.]|jgi:hypothetical protein|nr:ATP-binding protein [Tannerella sp.]